MYTGLLSSHAHQAARLPASAWGSDSHTRLCSSKLMQSTQVWLHFCSHIMVSSLWQPDQSSPDSFHGNRVSSCCAHRLHLRSWRLQMSLLTQAFDTTSQDLSLCVFRQALSPKVTQASIPADVCRAALQGVQGALPCVTPARQAALLAAVSSLSSRAPARSAVKAACLEFQLALLAKGGAVLYPAPGTGVPQLPEEVLVKWLLVSSSG